MNSVNPLYLIINNVFCIVEEGENGVKYLKIEKNYCDPVINKWNVVFDSIKYHIKKLAMKKKIVMVVLTKLNLLVIFL